LIDYLPFQRIDFSTGRCFFSVKNKKILTAQGLQHVPRLAFFYNQPMVINIANRQDLLLIPGVGEQTADRIVSFREHRGDIQSREDLELIQGIGKKMSEKIAKFVSFTQKP
jgi:competence ComEA-like helix-hairpin-helix protein